MKLNLKALIMASMALGLLAGCAGEPTPDSSTTKTESTSQPTETGSEVTPLPAKYSLMKHWAGHLEEDFYTVKEQTDKTVITYKDVVGEFAGGWAFVKRSFKMDAPLNERFGEYTKLVIKGKLETTAGTDVTMVKIEGNGVALEAKFNFLATEGTYELPLATIADWTKVENLLFFVNRSTNVSGSGTMTLSDIYLSKEAVVADHNIAGNLPTVPQYPNLYNGGDDLRVMDSWGYDDKNDIKTEGNATDGWTFTYGGEDGKKEAWSFVSANVEDGKKSIHDAGFKRIVFKVKGEANKTAKLKFQKADNTAAKEYDITFDGKEQEAEFDVTKVIGDAGTAYKALIFPAPNMTGAEAKGTIKLINVKLDKTAVTPVFGPDDNIREGNTVLLNKIKNSEAAYTITTTERTHVIDYKLTAVPDYKNFKFMVAGEKLEELRHISGKAVATVDVEILIKPYDAVEYKVALKANEEVDLDFTFAKANVNLNNPFIAVMIGTSDTSTLQGKVTLKNVQLDNLPSKHIETENTIDGANAEIRIKNFYGYDRDAYKVTTEGNVTTIDFDRSKATVNAWGDGCLKFRVDPKANLDDVKQYLLLSGTLKSTVKTNIIVKPFLACEFKAEPMEANKDYHFELAIPKTAVKAGAESHIYVAFNEDAQYAKAGQINIYDLRLSRLVNKDVDAETNSIHINNFYRAGDCFTVNNANNVTTIKVAKENVADDWNAIDYMVTDYTTRYTTLKGKIVATKDVKVLFKPYDNNPKMKTIELKAGVEQEINITDLEAVDVDVAKVHHIFIQGPNTNDVTVTLTNFRYALDEKIVTVPSGAESVKVNSFYAGDPCYKITNENNVSTVKVTKDATQEWANFKFALDGEHPEFTKVTMTIRADKALKVLFKAYNLGGPAANNGGETWIEVGTEAKEVTINLNSTNFNYANDCLFFVQEAGNVAVNATLTITNLTFTK